jgi:hypothetical protein
VPEVAVAPDIDPTVEPEAVPLPPTLAPVPTIPPEVSPLVVPTALPDVVPLDAAIVPDDRPALVPDPVTICVDPLCACAPVALDEPDVADAEPLDPPELTALPHAVMKTGKQSLASVASIRIVGLLPRHSAVQ